MSPAGGYLLEYGSKLLLEHSQCLVALVDLSGKLIEWNTSLANLVGMVPRADTFSTLLDPNSCLRFLNLIQQTLAEQQAGPVILNFVKSPTALPLSYRCHMVRAYDAHLVLLAEPIAPLDQQTAEQYLRVNNELAITTRNLQRASHELEQKQHLLENTLAQLEQIAQTDELTRLFNRRTILLKLQEEIQRATRYRSIFSVLLIDIDHFKQVNDRYGHPAGDEVLRACTSLIQHSIRNTDYLGRYGGEEFLVILPMTGVSAAAELAERMCRLVEQTPFTVAQTITFSLTISIGVAEFDPLHSSADLLIARADNVLFIAKTHGRNRHVVWSPEGSMTPQVS